MSTASAASDIVLHERRGGVLTITINRPAQKNAVDHEVAVRLAAALDLLDADPELSVGVLTGAGGVFSAGMDLKAFAKGELPVLPAGVSAGSPAQRCASRWSPRSRAGRSAADSRWCSPAT